MLWIKRLPRYLENAVSDTMTGGVALTDCTFLSSAPPDYLHTTCLLPICARSYVICGWRKWMESMNVKTAGMKESTSFDQPSVCPVFESMKENMITSFA